MFSSSNFQTFWLIQAIPTWSSSHHPDRFFVLQNFTTKAQILWMFSLVSNFAIFYCNSFVLLWLQFFFQNIKIKTTFCFPHLISTLFDWFKLLALFRHGKKKKNQDKSQKFELFVSPPLPILDFCTTDSSSSHFKLLNIPHSYVVFHNIPRHS